MSLSEKMATNLVPLMLRLGLGVVFMWAGWSKFSFRPEYTMEVRGADAALLANAGLLSPASAGPGLEVQEPTGEDEEAAPSDDAPEGEAPSDDAAQDENEGEGEGDATDPPDDAPAIASTEPLIIRAQAASNPPTYIATDFVEPVSVPRRREISLIMLKAANPADGQMALWPEALASKRMLTTLPWLAATVEFVGGFFLIFGFLTRLAALGLTGSIATAMLLTTIGPAIASGDNFLWIFPPLNLASAEWKAAWMPWLFQLVLLIMASSLVLTGAGKLSADRRLFGRNESRASSQRVIELEDE